MSTVLTKSLPLSFNFTMDEEAKACEKQGIVSILGSDPGKTKTTPSLRQTLSADMSSKKWLAENGFCSVRKISSSHELLAPIDDLSSTTSEGGEEEDYEVRKDLDEKERLDIWNSIQEAKLKEDREPEKNNELTSWASILSQKGEDSKSRPPPYVHPLAKRSASKLSGKSLEICTESLGSETGSDGFSSYPPSEVEDAEYDKAEENLPESGKQTPPEEEYALSPLKYNHLLGPMKAAQSRTVPPPLPSLSRENGASLSMRSSRNNGRFVLEAVSIPPQNNFQAQRCEGRLILTFMNHTSTLHQEVENEEGVEEEKKPLMELDEQCVVLGENCEDTSNGNEEEVEEPEEAEEKGETLNLDSLYGVKETGFSVEKAPNMPSGLMNLHKLASSMMNKPIGLPNRNPERASKFSEAVCKYADAAEEEEPVSLLQSLPLQPQVARMIPTPSAKSTSSFNAYEYFWRTKPTATFSVNVITKQPLSSLENYGNNCNMSKNSLVKNEIYYEGSVKSCNEPRWSSFFWEANCIAT